MISTATRYRLAVGGHEAHGLHRRSHPSGLRVDLKAAAIATLVSLFAATATHAEQPIPEDPPSGAWTPELDKTKPKSANTTVIERAGKNGALPGLKLVALLTGDGQQIDQGLVWRVFQTSGAAGKSKLVAESREASPLIKLQPGEYTVNAAFGQANLTRRIVVKNDGPPFEAFVLNAGGLRLSSLVAGKPAPPGTVSYAIYSDDREQFESQTAVLSGAKPDLIIRLNSGIYRIISQYGDANAKIETDVTVEAGKLTETTVAHSGGKATFKLVTRSGGEAMPDTRWTVQAADGEIVKESVGALPTHILAPGKYVVIASSGGNLFKSKFQIMDGDIVNVEVLMVANDDGNASPSSSGVPLRLPGPSGPAPRDFKNP